MPQYLLVRSQTGVNVKSLFCMGCENNALQYSIILTGSVEKQKAWNYGIHPTDRQTDRQMEKQIN